MLGDSTNKLIGSDSDLSIEERGRGNRKPLHKHDSQNESTDSIETDSYFSGAGKA